MSLARILLMTLGTGPSVEHAIAFSINTHKPDRVIFFATSESEGTRSKVEALLEARPQLETVHLSNGDNPDQIYAVVRQTLKKLRQEGIPHHELFADFTSGTKAMSAGLVTAAVAEGVKQLVYVTGPRGQDGRVLSGAESILTLQPAEMLADRLILTIIQLFNARLFRAALQLIEQGLPEISLPEQKQRLEDLRKLSRAYQSWDWFDHRQAAEHFEEIDREVIARWSPQIAQNKGWVNQIAHKLRSDAPIQERYCEELCIDLWLNAQRHIQEEYWIDATARLYRLTELIAQFWLARQYKLDTGDLDVSKLEEPLRSQYEGLRDERGRVRLGLKEAYELLAQLGDSSLGQCYDEQLRGLLRARNESIAGHGVQPVTEKNCRELERRVRELLGRVIPDWEEKARQGRFPQL